MAFEWQGFAQGDPDTDSRSVLYEMVAQDNPPEVEQPAPPNERRAGTVQAFLQEQRAADHIRRQATEGTLFGVLGSCTHHDLAQFIKHELRAVVVCTSLVANGVWYVYQRERHRWAFDPEGAEVLVRCLHILIDQVDRLRSELNSNQNTGVHEEAPRGRGRNGGGALRMPFSRLANFPEEANDPYEVQKAILVHLDVVVGDVRNMQSVVRYLGKLVTNRSFPDQLDVKNEHLVPFANGVLDLDTLRLRPGVPSDLVMRGPTYPWVDYAESDGDTEELERMLSQIFTDQQVLNFFLEVGGTWLRRRNRFKHFYVFTGNTNGGKSLLFSLVKMSFATLCGLLPIQALTGRDADASSHSDYLARTHGQAICVCNEPDSSTQVLMTEKVKMMVSDSDNLSVRHMYGTTRDMPIMWKLVTGDQFQFNCLRPQCCATPHRGTRSWTLRPSNGPNSYRAPPRSWRRVTRRVWRVSSIVRGGLCDGTFHPPGNGIWPGG